MKLFWNIFWIFLFIWWFSYSWIFLVALLSDGDPSFRKKEEHLFFYFKIWIIILIFLLIRGIYLTFKNNKIIRKEFEEYKKNWWKADNIEEFKFLKKIKEKRKKKY